MAGAALLAACDDDDNNSDINQPNTSTQLSEEYYAGGELGTVFNATSFAYEQPTPACENQGMAQAFKFGEYLFEKDFNQNEEGAFAGLGPLMVRRGCLYCHPQYGHGKRQTEYRADKMGNGYLLVITDENDTYLSSLTGMPQTLGQPSPRRRELLADLSAGDHPSRCLLRAAASEAERRDGHADDRRGARAPGVDHRRLRHRPAGRHPGRFAPGPMA
jgi:hypothetical protein